MTLRTEYEFTLPKGYVDDDGTLHRKGVMRLATARDEIEPLRDPRVAQNEAYLTVLVLSRVVTELGTLDQVTPRTIEGLFAADLAYLQDFYGVVNFGDDEMLAALEADAADAEGGGASEPPAPAGGESGSNGAAAAPAKSPARPPGTGRTRARASR
ncbi:MAG: hypothetical protein ABR511_05035 [Acidimicrobiales bacterium]